MGLFDFIVDAVESTVGLASDVVSGTIDLAGDMVSGTLDAVESTVGLASDVVSGTIDLAGDMVNGTLDTVESTVGLASDVVSGTIDLAGDMVNGTLDAVESTVGLASDVVSGTIDLAGDVVSGTFNVTADAIEGTVDIVKNNPIETIAILGMSSLGFTHLTGFIAKEVTTHIVDNYIKETVKPVEGSVLYCDLGGVAEHSGIYIGNGKIAHLDGSGQIEIITREGFINRLSGFNTALSIYVSCSNEGKPIGNENTSDRAMEMAGNRRNYNLILDNCHQFTSGCITGDFENSDNFFWMLKKTVEQYYSAYSWRVWN